MKCEEMINDTLEAITKNITWENERESAIKSAKRTLELYAQTESKEDIGCIGEALISAARTKRSKPDNYTNAGEAVTEVAKTLDLYYRTEGCYLNEKRAYLKNVTSALTNTANETKDANTVIEVAKTLGMYADNLRKIVERIVLRNMMEITSNLGCYHADNMTEHEKCAYIEATAKVYHEHITEFGQMIEEVINAAKSKKDADDFIEIARTKKNSMYKRLADGTIYPLTLSNSHGDEK